MEYSNFDNKPPRINEHGPIALVPSRNYFFPVRLKGKYLGENYFVIGTYKSVNKYYLSTLTCQIIVQQILLFFGEKNTYTTLLGPTRLLISEIFPSKPDFHLYK